MLSVIIKIRKSSKGMKCKHTDIRQVHETNKKTEQLKHKKINEENTMNFVS